jgi:hypothetical protein
MHPGYSSETATFFQNYLAMINTVDVTGGKPIAVYSQSISGVNAINSLFAFYDIHRKKSKVLFFYFVPDTTRDKTSKFKLLILQKFGIGNPRYGIKY